MNRNNATHYLSSSYFTDSNSVYNVCLVISPQGDSFRALILKARFISIDLNIVA